jgi:hypothetical protein
MVPNLRCSPVLGCVSNLFSGGRCPLGCSNIGSWRSSSWSNLVLDPFPVVAHRESTTKFCAAVAAARQRTPTQCGAMYGVIRGRGTEVGRVCDAAPQGVWQVPMIEQCGVVSSSQIAARRFVGEGKKTSAVLPNVERRRIAPAPGREIALWSNPSSRLRRCATPENKRGQRCDAIILSIAVWTNLAEGC